MAPARSKARLRRWIPGIVILGIAALIACLVLPNVYDVEFGGGAGTPDSPTSSAQPTLEVRGEVDRLGESREDRGEARPKKDEVWFEEYTLEEEIADSDPEIIVARVLDGDGRPVSDAFVNLSFDEDDAPDDESTAYGMQPDENGYVIFDGLEKRRYRITAARPIPRERDWRKGRPQSDTEIAWVERVVVDGIDAGRRDVRVRMATRPQAPEEAWTARVRVFGPDGEEVRRWSYTECSHTSRWSSIEGWVEPDAGKPGIVHFHGAPPFGLLVHGVVDEDYESLPIAPGFIPNIVPDAGVYTLHLKRSQGIRGRVRLPEGVEYANVVVRYAILASGRAEDPLLVGESTPPGAWAYDMTGTDEAGRFELEGLPPGRVRLIPLPAGSSLEEAPDDLGTTVAVGDADARLVLPAYAPITGTIDLGATEGADQRHVQVHVRRHHAGERPILWSKHYTLTDLQKSEGRFETPPLSQDDVYDVEVWAQGVWPETTKYGYPIATRTIERVTAGGSPLFVVLQRLPEIRGRVRREDGAPLPKKTLVFAMREDTHPLVRAAWRDPDDTFLEIAGRLDDLVAGRGVSEPREPVVLPPPRAIRWQARVAEDGSFHLPGLPKGRYVLWCKTPGALGQLADPPVPAGSGAVELVLRAAGRITGRVRDPGGAPLDGFVVQARDAQLGGRVLASSLVRSDGYFDLSGLRPGAYLVSAFNARDASDTRAAAYARVPEGTRDLAVVLRAGRVVAGIVSDDQGKPVEGARVLVRSTLDERETRASDNGRFRVAGLLGSTFALRVALPDGRKVEALLEGGSEDVRLVVP